MSMANSAEPIAGPARSSVGSVEYGVRRRRRASAGLAAVLAVVAAVLCQLWGAPLAGASPSLQSTGSSFASVAIQQWVGQSSTLYGLNINWQVTSSVIGLNNFATNQVDFGASDIPYSSGQAQSTPTIPYQYMPDVAGGLSFMYNLMGKDGQRITNIILNASTVADIFLGKITKWNDPSIAQLNPQLAGDLPSTQIIAVYRLDASGENYLLSDYLLHQDASVFTAAQNAFESFEPGQPDANWPVPPTGFNFSTNPGYPGWQQGTPTGQNGSDNAANYVSALSSVGAITYVETAYAKEHNLPVASLVNASNNAVQPTSLNVATALEAAILHADLTQDLTNVYTNPLPNAYPLSAYSYLVTPCSPQLAQTKGGSCAANSNAPSTFPSQKGQALGQFVSFLACAGQEQMATLGYSPLPPNLVQEDFNAVGRLNGGQELPPVSPSDCKNPYVDGEIPLPGEPAIAGQAGGGIQPTSTAAAAARGSGAGGSAAGPGGSAGGSAGGSGNSGSTGSGSVSAAAAAAGLTAAEAAKGYRVVNGKIVKTLEPCPNKYKCADALLAATGSVDGPRNLAVVGGVLLVLAIVLAPPVIASRRRRRTPDEADEAESADPSIASLGAES